MNAKQVQMWDVLIITVWLVNVFLLQLRFTWISVAACACICMHNRDLDIHETFVALHMLRYTCGAIECPTPWLTAPVILLGVWSRFSSYLSMQCLKRRLCTLISAFMSLSILHVTSELPVVVAMRVALFVVLTRYGKYLNVDSWDCVAQSGWILSCTPYVLCLVVLQVNDMISSPAVNRRAKGPSYVWTSKGVTTVADQV